MVVMRMAAGGLLAAGCIVALVPTSSQAAFPGSNGRIVFICREAGASATDVCSMNPDGSDLLNLTRSSQQESAPDVSLDGSRIAFLRREPDTTSRLWVMNMDGSGQTQLTQVPTVGASWTPDDRIGFRAQTGPSSWEFQIVSAQGGAATRLADAFPSDYPPRFNAAGAWLYGTGMPIPPANTQFTQQIFVVNGGSTVQVTQASAGLTSNQEPSWSPDGRTIVYWRGVGTSQLYTIPATGGAETPLIHINGVREKMPAYSPDGSKLIWQQEDATHNAFNTYLVVADANGANPTAISTPSLDAAAAPVWAPAASSPQPGGGTSPEPTPTPTPTPSTPVAAFTATAPSKGKKTKPLTVTLRCIGDTDCEVTYRATVRVPRPAAKPKAFRIAATRVDLAARTDKSVRLSLPKPAKKLAASTTKRVSVTIPLTATQPGGSPLIRQMTLTSRLR